jgi:hypothetical protein
MPPGMGESRSETIAIPVGLQAERGSWGLALGLIVSSGIEVSSYTVCLKGRFHFSALH